METKAKKKKFKKKTFLIMYFAESRCISLVAGHENDDVDVRSMLK